MKTPILFILAVTAMFVVTVNSCTKTVTQTVDVDSTIRDTVTLRDTLRDSLGAASSLRFISLFPDSISNGILSFSTSSNESYIAYAARDAVSPDYIEAPPNTATTYYVFVPNQSNPFGSIQLPALAAGSLSTVAVFDGEINGIESVKFALGNDSAILTPPPAGFCYLRFANGVPDYPSPSPYVNVDIDNADTSIFRQTNGTDMAYGWGEISPYALISSGFHVLNLRDPVTGSVVYQSQNTFQSGFYYTGHTTGSQTAGNAKFAIDQE